jgi:arsenical pump membrane protein
VTAVREAVAFASFGLTISLALTRPRLRHHTLGPAAAAAAGVTLTLVAGSVTPDDVRHAATELGRPLVTVASIMVTTAAAVHLGVIQRLAAAVVARAGDSVTRLFNLVFVLGAVTAAVLNNDGAILLLTPLVVMAVRGLYPDKPEIVIPFAFAVFLAAGVAPLMISNPMNMIVADAAGIGFNRYAAHMIPVSVPGWLLTLWILRRIFRAELDAAGSPTASTEEALPWTGGQRAMILLLLTVLAAYPVVSYLGGPIWAVASAGALLAIVLCWRQGVAGPRELVLRGVAWQVLAFLFGVFVLAHGLRNAGVVDWLSDSYQDAGVGLIGFASAIGSALIDNHPMAILNLFAIEQTPTLGERHILGALIGGDLGPRLLPIGSLAGLLWFDSLRRHDVHVTLRQFVSVGATVTAPGLLLSLSLLRLVADVIP